MTFRNLSIAGAFLIEPELLEDDRGFFARTWCADEFMEHDIPHGFVQCNVSFNKHERTIRGLHYQTPPHSEAKLVRCTRGAIFDVIVDLRIESPTFKKWIGAELTETNHLMMYIPEGCAHGFQSLRDNTEVFYQMSDSYASELARGVRWNDPAFGITWPLASPILSLRDAGFTDYEP